MSSFSHTEHPHHTKALQINHQLKCSHRFHEPNYWSPKEPFGDSLNAGKG